MPCNKRCTGNLGGKVVGLAFAKPKQSLALLEYNLQGPSPGIDLIGLEEAKSQVSAKQPAPRATLAWSVPWRSCQSFLFALLPKDGKVKKHLAYSIRNTKEECLETEDSPVLKMVCFFCAIIYSAN